MHWPCSITLNQRRTRSDGNQSCDANCDVRSSVGAQKAFGSMEQLFSTGM